jgi:hypothetical protein
MALGACLVDTNILLRATRRADPQHEVASTSLARLANQGTLLNYTQHRGALEHHDSPGGSQRVGPERG